ncbi:hypothetical protein RFI_27625 [Reticulomyxa filosa]|uniref:Uncharacterized protein n=1 Tax=Reticulomyxa filosa TaxID=46433 RepID=X6M7Y2_RETFI|nr:hypothetical protein RFI_27625 [Reticulomyxa filosa]|eukprot:ETO09751.1 hypothetical protein RFI_27625 [Reticulomyxa filosa]
MPKIWNRKGETNKTNSKDTVQSKKNNKSNGNSPDQKNTKSNGSSKPEGKGSSMLSKVMGKKGQDKQTNGIKGTKKVTSPQQDQQLSPVDTEPKIIPFVGDKVNLKKIFFFFFFNKYFFFPPFALFLKIKKVGSIKE